MAAAAERTAKRRPKRPGRPAAAKRTRKSTTAAAEPEPGVLFEAPPAVAEPLSADEADRVQQPGIVPGLAVALVGVMAWLVFGFWVAAVILCAAAVVAVLGTMVRF